MSLACLVCYSVESPSHSFRSYSMSSSKNEGRKCSAIGNCLLQAAKLSTFIASSSKVTPQPPPRLVRSCAVRRDIVIDWNFNEDETET